MKIITTDNKEFYYNENLACVACNLSFDDLEPRHFSFNSPYGACEKCDGLGTSMRIDPERIISDNKQNIISGCIAPVGEPHWNNWFNSEIYNLSCDIVGSKSIKLL